MVIRNISPTCAVSLPGATLRIVYRTSIGDPSPCSNSSFYDWSYLNLGVTGNGECAVDGVLEEGVFVNTVAPAMTLGLSGLPSFVSPCGTYTLTLTAQRTSATPAYDAVIDLVTTTYQVLDVVGFGGATPVMTTTDASGYHWFYADAFSSVTTATVQVRVQLRCASGSAPLNATLYYDNICQDDTTYREQCSAGGAIGSAQVVDCLPIITKFPEVIFATGDVVTWTLTVFNSGAGPAYSVTLSDVLGSGLQYQGYSITATNGATASVITSAHGITFSIPVVQPKEKVTIKLWALIINCSDLTNTLYGKQGCLGESCHPPCVRTSHVELPQTVLINTNNALTPLGMCATESITATVRNAGLLSVYTATITESLPAGLFYVSGSSEYVLGTGTTPPGSGWLPAGDPSGAPIGPLVWGPAQIAALARLYPSQTVWVRFRVTASCLFAGGNVTVQAGYLDSCRTPHRTTASSYRVNASQPGDHGSQARAQRHHRLRLGRDGLCGARGDGAVGDHADQQQRRARALDPRH